MLSFTACNIECVRHEAYTVHAWIPVRPSLQNGAYLKERAAVKERLGLTFDAILDYSASIPLLREAGLPTAEAVFNRGYCQR